MNWIDTKDRGPVTETPAGRVDAELLGRWAEHHHAAAEASYHAITRMARELLAARKVVEAARNLDHVRLHHMVPSQEETDAAALVAHAITAYDRTTGET